MDALHSVSVAKVAELLDLNNLTKEMNLKERAIECSDVNRPALQLSDYRKCRVYLYREDERQREKRAL